jgi:hypothetical protein
LQVILEDSSDQSHAMELQKRQLRVDADILIQALVYLCLM